MDHYSFIKFFHLLLNIIILSFLVQTTLSQNPKFKACESKKCGTNLTISYPFWISHEQESYCGHPNFQITCINQEPILPISKGDYLIRNISYIDQSFAVASMNDLKEPCPTPRRNFTLLGSPFSYSINDNDLFFFYDCELTPADHFTYSIPCYKNKSRSHYSFAMILHEEGLEYLNSTSEKCESFVSVPIEMDADSSTENMTKMEYSKLLRNGFALEWNSSSIGNCNFCEASGGRCGFEKNEFICFCQDKSYPKSCKIVPPPPKRITEKKAKIEIVAGVGGCLITAIILFFVIFPLWKKGNNKNNNDQNLEVFFRNNESFAPKRFRYVEVNKMTNSFKEKLGEGGYGSVFKGKLQDGRLVAVKILLDKHKSTSNNGEEFLNEVASISRTSHVNVVSLLGFCYEKDKRALIYEFMPNGSLDKFIYNKNISLESSLEWKILYEIAIGIARGLGYLHRGCSTRIIHFDIKPHNILLDEDFSPKIADFGLAKLCPGKESIISMLDARGTAGYIAPEVFNRNFGEVSHKSDVYSYGMMIVEMVGGRKNFDVKVGKDHSSQLYFPDWIYDHLNLEGGLGLQGIMIEESEEVVAKKMIIVGLWCIQINPSSRPSMSKVLEMLEGSLEALQIPPKPFLYSRARSWPSATGSSSLIEIK